MFKQIFIIISLFVCSICCFGQDNATLAHEYNKRGNEYLDKMDYHSALVCYTQALRYYEQAWGRKSENYISMYSLYAYTLGLVGRTDESLKAQIEAAELNKEVYGQKSEQYASSLSMVASTYGDIGQTDKALATYKESISIFDKIGSSSDLYFTAIKGMSGIYFQLGKFTDALAISTKALKTVTEKYGENSALYADKALEVANILSTLGRYNEALAYGDKAMRYYNNAGDNKSVNYLASLGIYANLCGKIDINKGISEREKQIRIISDNYGTDNYVYTSSISILASNYMNSDRYDEAIKYYRQAIDILSRNNFGEMDELSDDMINLAMCYGYIHESDNCKYYADKACELTRNIFGENSLPYADKLVKSGMLYNEISLKESNDRLFKAKDLLEAQGQTRTQDYLDCLKMLAVNSSNMGNEIYAQKYYDEALDVCKSVFGENSDTYVALLMQQADNTKAFDKRNNLKHKALDISRNIYGTSQNISYAFLLQSVAMDDYECAKTLKFLKEYRQNAGGDTLNLSTMSQNKFKQAIDELNATIDIYTATSGKDHHYVAETRNTLATVYNELGDFDKAHSLLDQNLQSYRQIYGESHPKYIETVEKIGRVLYSQKRYNEAETYFDKALAAKEKIYDKDNAECIEDLLLKSMCECSTNQDDRLYTTNSDMLSRIKDNVTSHFSWMNSEERSFYWNSMLANIDICISNFSSGDNTPNEGKVADMGYEAALFSKGILLSSEIGLRKLILESGNQEIIDEFNRLVDNKVRLDKLYKLPVDQRTEDADRLLQTIRRSETALVQKSAILGDFMSNMNISPEDVKRKLKAGDVAIEFAKSSFALYAFVMTKDADHAKKILIAGDYLIDKAIPSDCFATDTIYNLIWKPLEKYTANAKNIYFAPDGKLYGLPLETIFSSRHGNEGKSIFRLSSTRELAMKEKTVKVSAAAVYGGINYDVKLTADSGSADSQRGATVSAGKTNVFGFRSRFGYLKGTLTEAENVSKILSSGKIKVTTYLADKGTESSFRALSGTGCNIIHVATHGFYYDDKNANTASQSDYKNEEDIALSHSGLIFAGANALVDGTGTSGAEDGILTAEEICKLDLRSVDLVVLSACETGSGDITADGVAGLQRAFKKAGVKSVIMSLWPVDDAATEMMMTSFYKYHTKGMTKSDALIKAKQDVKTKYSDPRKWAAFVLLD